jgi:hypothetical protein
LRLLNFLFLGLGGGILIFPQKMRVCIETSFQQKTLHRFQSSIIIMSAMSLLYFTPYTQGVSAQFNAVFQGKPFLYGNQQQNTYSMINVYPQLLASVNQQTRVLAMEHQWLLAFADVDLEKVFQMHSLPPFEDHSGQVEQLLETMDVIWVSDSFIATDHQPAIVQQHLRYTYHVKPFLKKKMKQGWIVEKIPNFGKIYHRPHLAAITNS